MNIIQLQHILPDVFKGTKNLESDVWLQNLSFEKGKFYLIEAVSGKGKTSLCSYIYGQRTDFSGNILFDQTNIHIFFKKDWTTIRQKNISFVFQDLRLFPELSALENIQLKNNLTHHKTASEIEKCMEIFGISDKTNALIGKMSFGQQQRIAIIRACCQPFDFILLDEPISHLDDKNGKIVADFLLEEVKKKNAGIIVTSIGKHIDLPYSKVIQL